jgi:hypothetical protein
MHKRLKKLGIAKTDPDELTEEEIHRYGKKTCADNTWLMLANTVLCGVADPALQPLSTGLCGSTSTPAPSHGDA